MDLTNLEKSIVQLIEIIRETALAPETVRGYEKRLHTIKTYCLEHNVESFNYQTAEAYGGALQARVKNNEICAHYASRLKGTALQLADFLSSESENYSLVPHRVAISAKRTLNDFDKRLLDEFSDHLNLRYAEKSVKEYTYVAASFLHFIEAHRIAVGVLASSDIRDYFVFVSPRRTQSLDSVADAVKAFFSFLSVSGRIDWSVEKMSFRTPPARKKVPVAYTEGEISQLLNCIDRETPIGKRDYAAIILSLNTGMRSVDVRHLKLEDIHWQANEIHIVQHKTNRELVMPLLPIVGNAIADYILHGRPASKVRYVFLSHRSRGAGGMGEGALKSRMQLYLNLSEMKKHKYDGRDFHALRKTFATNILVSGAPLEAVSNALGDVNVQSAKPYLALDDEKLRQCCLASMKFPCLKEGLHA